jgi:hypothetical protein
VWLYATHGGVIVTSLKSVHCTAVVPYSFFTRCEVAMKSLIIALYVVIVSLIDLRMAEA